MKYFCSFKNGKEKNEHVIQVSMKHAMWNEKGKLLHETVNYEILKTLKLWLDSCIYTYNREGKLHILFSDLNFS